MVFIVLNTPGPLCSGLNDALMHGFGLGVSICITNLIKYIDWHFRSHNSKFHSLNLEFKPILPCISFFFSLPLSPVFLLKIWLWLNSKIAFGNKLTTNETKDYPLLIHILCIYVQLHKCICEFEYIFIEVLHKFKNLIIIFMLQLTI